MSNYSQVAKGARIKTLELIFKAGTSHIGSCLSAIDIMAVLFEKADPLKDEVALSAGWKAAAWYYFLWKRGVITEKELNSFCQPGSPFIGLVEPRGRWGLRIAGGSMGLGLPGAVGLALAKKLKGEEGRVYVLMSDGEIATGTTWESLAIADHHKLNNLIVMIDWNGLQAMGNVTDILKPKVSFEFYNGHDFEDIEKALQISGKDCSVWLGFKTVKGKGVSFMENNNLWHYAQIKKDDYEKALAELHLCQN